MRLRADASPDNLQWLTELVDAKTLLESDAWKKFNKSRG
jgi:hypothetical protein